jgi:hypothetical protein
MSRFFDIEEIEGLIPLPTTKNNLTQHGRYIMFSTLTMNSWADYTPARRFEKLMKQDCWSNFWFKFLYKTVKSIY